MVHYVKKHMLCPLDQVLELVNFCPMLQHDILSVCNTTLFGNMGVHHDDVIHSTKHICSIVCTDLSHETRTNLVNELLQFHGNVCLCLLVPNCVNRA
jgi:hypothetical protein